MQERDQAPLSEQTSDLAMGVSQAPGTAAPTESEAAEAIVSSPMREERTESAEKVPESPVILIVSSRASTSSPTTGLVSTGVLNRPVSLPPSPQPSIHDDEVHQDYSGGDFGIDYSVDTSLPDPSKFSNFTFEDFDAEFPMEGKSQLHRFSCPDIEVFP